MYFESLYNESRNAVPSWQGYTYQGEVAILKYLELINTKFDMKLGLKIPPILRIEWMEDFVLKLGDSIVQIYQVKKTLTRADFFEVIQSFIIQSKLLNYESEWFIVYGDIENGLNLDFSEAFYLDIFDSYINAKVRKELTLLKDNRENKEFWKINLNLRNTESQLPTIKAMLRKIIETESMIFKNITVKDCVYIADTHIEALLNNLVYQENDYLKFKDRIKLEKVEFNTIKSNSIDLIEKLLDKGVLIKNDLDTFEDVYEGIYINVYDKLMKIKNKKKDLLEISFKDLEGIFTNDLRMNDVWLSQIINAREEMRERFSEYCETCGDKTCNDCNVTKFLELDFYELIENSNVDFARFRPESIALSLRNKIGRDKNRYLATRLLEFRAIAFSNGDRNCIEINNSHSNLLISQIISDDHIDNKRRIIENMNDHVVIYREYNKILTRYFSEVIDFGEVEMLKTEFDDSNAPSFMDILPIVFVTNNDEE